VVAPLSAQHKAESELTDRAPEAACCRLAAVVAVWQSGRVMPTRFHLAFLRHRVDSGYTGVSGARLCVYLDPDRAAGESEESIFTDADGTAACIVEIEITQARVLLALPLHRSRLCFACEGVRKRAKREASGLLFASASLMSDLEQ